MKKKDARKLIKQKKALCDEFYLLENSLLIQNRIFEDSDYKKCTNLLIYVNYNQEVITTGIIKNAIESGKNVFVPKVFDNEMEFLKITDLSMLKPGKYSIPEPDDGCEIFSQHENEKTVVIMPGLAFDSNLNRAGYGGGFYDRYFCRHTDNVKIAVCFDFQVLDNIETEAFDLRPDRIYTPTRIIKPIVKE